MVRLSKLTDYAVVLLTQIVRRDGASMTTAQLAADTGVPQPTVSKILKLLVKAGLLTAQRGASGGYQLARPARSISVADIVVAMDGPISITDCSTGSVNTCQVEKICPISGHWNKINSAINHALQSVVLYDMAMDVPAALKEPRKLERAHAR